MIPKIFYKKRLKKGFFFRVFLYCFGKTFIEFFTLLLPNLPAYFFLSLSSDFLLCLPLNLEHKLNLVERFLNFVFILCWTLFKTAPKLGEVVGTWAAVVCLADPSAYMALGLLPVC